MKLWRRRFRHPGKGLSAQRIYQDLVTELRFTGSYESVKSFVRRLGAVTPLPWQRMDM